jgi:hypothetical protein
MNWIRQLSCDFEFEFEFGFKFHGIAVISVWVNEMGRKRCENQLKYELLNNRNLLISKCICADLNYSSLCMKSSFEFLRKKIFTDKVWILRNNLLYLQKVSFSLKGHLLRERWTFYGKCSFYVKTVFA